ncbi:chloride channel protein [Caulobacter sp. KR2-114]|uniref:chloride channel protein n=1 Tax=Caulobacter sp. KR2-114 TaxID=3400912 RepID=UPI003BFF3B47
MISALAALRGQIRASELWLVVIATAVGAVSGLAALGIGALAHGMQTLLYGIDFDERLSAVASIPPARAAWLPVGGLLLGLATWLWSRRRPSPAVDPVEANALHGGRMSLRDSLSVVAQTILSNGFGASVGLEAGYAQIGGALASLTGIRLNLRRSDLRTFVGAGAGAAIAAAFGAPLTGAFYAFEVVIGSYTVANIAPVAAAALAGSLMTKLMGVDPLVIHARASVPLTAVNYALFAALGLVCAVFAVGLMRLVAWTERVASLTPGPKLLRPAVGGVLLAALALIAPQTLSAGHGAMHLDLSQDLAISALAFLVATKAAASVVSLGFGFRGGLFFASLYLGSLIGRLCALGLAQTGLHTGIEPLAGAMVGMGALAVAVIGGPFTMSFLVLETTNDFGLTAATLTASLVASVLVRETFGYSFSTWRLHLRGETIRSAHDVGWLRTLTAGRMMRGDPATIAADAPLSEFRRRFPLGSTRRVVALDPEGRYAGLVAVSKVYADEDGEGLVGENMTHQDDWLTPQMDIKEIMKVFDQTESDELVVLDDKRDVLGLLSEAYATRRYAEELEKARRDLVGGD